ncbi:hypothetical protein D9619_002476 [Psilocybe cf. subviscida]|uniref:Uncharacterized protein n=1 Tax=Psilocybe cf. subviscida TaxID=2480587 RepID=A0A8H5AXQ4_9AGAR|nr:hypothetical protein D9619_002476 [Psilocybe cf. subviscida]
MANPSNKVAAATTEIPTTPSTSLPPLGRLSSTSTERIKVALRNLQILYFPPSPSTSTLVPPKLAIPERHIHHPIHDISVPDSGYASAEEDEEDFPSSEIDVELEELELLRADELERAYSIKWVTGFISRADVVWASSTETDEETEERAALLEEAISLLSAFTGSKEEDEVALTRIFAFPTPNSSPSGDRPDSDAAGKQQIYIELNDAPLAKDDHTSVGLQSWGSSIILADRFCLDPGFFSLAPVNKPKSLRILELGAGTGMLSIVASKLLHPTAPETEIVATDYHPDVLANLALNVSTNFSVMAREEQQAPTIEVLPLDWESPNYAEAPFDRPFDLILAADVVYHPLHAQWIKACIERLLTRPNASSQTYATSDSTDGGGVFWLIIPVRTTGRHEGMAATVDELFPDAASVLTKSAPNHGGPVLAVLYREEHGRQGSIGRADEGAYKLFKIGWVN